MYFTSDKIPTIRYWKKATGHGVHVYEDLEQPTRQIRLIRFIEGDRWEMSTHNLDEAPLYRALSYTWDAESADAEIVILDDMVFAMTRTLSRFFATKRSPTSRQSWWWVDQISINQSSWSERSAQVSIMAEIYRRAEKVVIWLDGLSSQTCQVFHIELQSEIESLNEYRSKRVLDATKELFDHRYWSRIWIVQELFFAKQVFIAFDSGTITFEQVKTISEYCAKSWVRMPERLKWFVDNASSFEDPLHIRLRRLDEVVRVFSNSGCSDVRDKVYGIAGLLIKEHRPEIEYHNTVAEVFMEAVGLLTKHWPDAEPLKDLVSVCLRLGAEMMPKEMALHKVFDRMAVFTGILERQIDVSDQKNEVVAAFQNLVDELDPDDFPFLADYNIDRLERISDQRKRERKRLLAVAAMQTLT